MTTTLPAATSAALAEMRERVSDLAAIVGPNVTELADLGNKAMALAAELQALASEEAGLPEFQRRDLLSSAYHIRHAYRLALTTLRGKLDDVMPAIESTLHYLCERKAESEAA